MQNNPKDPEYEDIMEWLGDEPIDPNEFDKKYINKELKKIKYNRKWNTTIFYIDQAGTMFTSLFIGIKSDAKQITAPSPTVTFSFSRVLKLLIDFLSGLDVF